MCGLAGFLSLNYKTPIAPSVLAKQMADRIVHRGPDAEGIWFDNDAGIALAHRRLSILDLSPAGAQPMLSPDGRYVVAFNGEIYNHNDLRESLRQKGVTISWRGHSDTETLLACIQYWGLEETLKSCVGMFALALWDRHTKTLRLARDRFGEKPLYYGMQSGAFLFASEIKSLLAHPSFSRKIDRNSVALFLRHNYIPAPWSIWEGILKLPPATILSIDATGKQGEPTLYWSLDGAIEGGKANPFMGTLNDASTELEEVLGNAISQQMLSDVPLGALLSGGIDSSTIAALMQSRSSRAVRTYSIGFPDKQFDESQHAAAVARHLGTDHTELTMRPSDVLSTVPSMPSLYDEPFADSSQLPTSLVMALAKQHVTVVLTGDAGDEVFGGYNRYFMVPRLWSYLRWAPAIVREKFAKLLLSIPAHSWNRLTLPLNKFFNQVNIGDKLHKLGDRLEYSRDIDSLYLALVTEWRNAEKIAVGAKPVPTVLTSPNSWPNVTAPEARMMALDTLTYMTDDILVKVDRAAMGVSLETRAPFLDHRVVEFAWRLPLHYKIDKGIGKRVLREVLYRHVPKELIDRPKMGFGIPLDSWLRHELRDWAEDLLDPTQMREDGLLDPTPIHKAWNQHLSGERAFGYRLWSVLMFQAWLRTWT